MVRASERLNKREPYGDRVSERVEERQRSVQSVVPFRHSRLNEALTVCDDIEVRQNRSLGQTRRTARIDDRIDVGQLLFSKP